MHLFLDTSQTDEIVVRFTLPDGSQKERRVPSKHVRSQALLQTVITFLTESNATVSDITEITVATGPGSFTGLKVGAAVGAVLSWLLSIPVNGLPPGTIPPITYGEEKWQIPKHG